MQYLGITVDTSNTVELVIGIIGIFGAVGSISVYLATISQRQLTATELAKLSARFQRLIDRNKVEIGALKMRIRDLENFGQREGFIKRPDFPENSLPDERTDNNNFEPY